MNISIVIFYNKDRGFLKDCIKAAESQKFDGTFEVIVQQGNYGASKNINDGIKRARGKYIKGCAEDDLLTENCIQDLYDFAEQGYDFVCANAFNFYPRNVEVYQSVIPDTISELALQNTIHGLTVLMDRQMILDVGGYPEHLTTGEEFELYLRIADAGYRFGYVNRIVGKYRIWSGMKSGWIGGVDKIKRREYLYENIRYHYSHNHKKIQR